MHDQNFKNLILDYPREALAFFAKDEAIADFYQKHERLPIYFAAQLGLLTIESNPNKQRKYIDFIDFYANLSEEEMTEFRTNYLNKAGEMMGLAQILKEEGRQEEASKLFLLLLKSKFGSVSQQLQDKVRTANAELIESWTKQIFDATTAEELLDG